MRGFGAVMRKRRSTVNKKMLAAVLVMIISATGVTACGVWLGCSSNPKTPAGYVGYLTQGSLFGKTEFYGIQKGPTSPGRTWLLDVVNVSVTPYTFTEKFIGANAMLSHDQLKLDVTVRVTFKIDEKKVKEFVEQYSALHESKEPNAVVESAYENFLQPQLRAFLRDEIQRRDWQTNVSEMMIIGQNVEDKIVKSVEKTPFSVGGIVIDSIHPPETVASAVSLKLAALQILERKHTEVEITQQDAARRVAEAKGIADAMKIINDTLTPMYLQHEAIEAQKAMVGSPSHTTVYIPVGNNGVPIVSTRTP